MIRVQGAVARVVILGVSLVSVLGVSSGDESKSQLFPGAYGIIGQEQYMFPVDMGDWPVRIDSRRQLFFDNYLVKSIIGLRREYHKLERHVRNPVYKPSKPLGGPLLVIRDSDGRFRMWVWVNLNYVDKDGNKRRYPTAYLESDDGLDWREPRLDIVEADGSRDNNFVFEKPLMGIFHEPSEKDPKRRFKALANLEPEYDKEKVEGYWIYVSPDGIRWTRDYQNPVITSLRKYEIPLDGIGDTSSFRWDPVLNEYICNAKFVFPGKYRAFGICESDDLVHWTPPRMMFYRDDKDPVGMQFYAHQTFCYESLWFGFIKTMIMTEPEPGKFWKHCELQLSLSRDGRNFTRIPDRTPLFPVPLSQTWDMDYPSVAAGEPIRMGDELWFYYSDRRHGARPGPGPDSSNRPIGVATLRVDGFASLNAGDEQGTVVTRPLTFQGKSLFVNADIAEGGFVKAELRGTWGEPIQPFTIDQCRPTMGNATKAQIRWAGRDGLQGVAQTGTRLVFELRNAKLYSFWIE